MSNSRGDAVAAANPTGAARGGDTSVYHANLSRPDVEPNTKLFIGSLGRDCTEVCAQHVGN